MSKIKTIASWVPLVLLALPMMAAGTAKLMGVEQVHQSFAMMGLPAGFGYFIGAAEVAGGIAILIPRLAALSAIGLAIIMAGAAYFHIAYEQPPALPAFIFIGLCIYAFWLRKSQLFFLASKEKKLFS